MPKRNLGGKKGGSFVKLVVTMIHRLPTTESDVVMSNSREGAIGSDNKSDHTSQSDVDCLGDWSRGGVVMRVASRASTRVVSSPNGIRKIFSRNHGGKRALNKSENRVTVTMGRERKEL